MPSAQGFSTNLGLASLPEIDQQINREVYLDIMKIRGALRILQGALDNYCGILGEDPTYWSTAGVSWQRVQNLTRFYCLASENIAQGAIANIYNNAGTPNARNANATDATKPARAYCTTAVTAGNYGEFILEGAVSINGLTPGTLYYLSNTNGIISNAAGTVSQKVGYALTATTLFFRPDL